jgi:hypothetical protein
MFDWLTDWLTKWPTIYLYGAEVFLEADSRLYSQLMLHILRKPKMNCVDHESPILIQMNPFQNRIFYLFKIRFSISLQSSHRSLRPGFVAK